MTPPRGKKAAAPSGGAAARTSAQSPLVAIVGDEELRKQALLDQAIAAAGADASIVGWATEAGESPGREFARLHRDLASAPLFGGRKVVVIRDGDAFLKRHAAALPALLDLPTQNRVVLLARAMDGRTAVARRLNQAGALLKCERPSGDDDRHGAASELVQAVESLAAERGLELGRGVADELAGRTGNDLLMVANELEKLSLYLAGAGTTKSARVSLADVESVVPRSATYDQFKLFEEVARGRSAAALERLRGMLHDGTADRRGRRTTDPRAIGAILLALLHNRLRMLGLLRDLSARGLTGDALREALGVRNPGQMFFLRKEADLPLATAAADAIELLAEADRGLKSSAPAEVVLTSLVTGLCRVAAASRGAAGDARR